MFSLPGVGIFFVTGKTNIFFLQEVFVGGGMRVVTISAFSVFNRDMAVFAEAEVFGVLVA